MEKGSAYDALMIVLVILVGLVVLFVGVLLLTWLFSMVLDILTSPGNSYAAMSLSAVATVLAGALIAAAIYFKK